MKIGGIGILIFIGVLLISMTIGCVEKPNTPIVYIPKVTLEIYEGKLMIYLRPSIGSLILYKNVRLEINNNIVLNLTSTPGFFIKRNLTNGSLEMKIYVVYVDEYGKEHVYYGKYSFRITSRGIYLGKIYYGKSYTAYLPEVKENGWQI